MLEQKCHLTRRAPLIQHVPLEELKVVDVERPSTRVVVVVVAVVVARGLGLLYLHPWNHLDYK